MLINQFELPDFWIRFILSFLAVYRFAFLMTNEEGPGGIFVKFRQFFWRRYGTDSAWGRAVECVLCQSVWYSAVAALVVFPWMGFFNWFLLWLGIAGAVAIVFVFIHGR